MKILLILFLLLFSVAALLAGCVPSPVTAETAQVHDWPADSSQPLRTCDELGSCCYTVFKTGSISCVAAPVKMIITYSKEPKSPAELQYQCGSYDKHGEPVWQDCGPPIVLPFQPDPPTGQFQDESQRQPTITGEVRNPALEARLLRNYRFGDH